MYYRGLRQLGSRRLGNALPGQRIPTRENIFVLLASDAYVSPGFITMAVVTEALNRFGRESRVFMRARDLLAQRPEWAQARVETARLPELEQPGTSAVFADQGETRYTTAVFAGEPQTEYTSAVFTGQPAGTLFTGDYRPTADGLGPGFAPSPEPSLAGLMGTLPLILAIGLGALLLLRK